MKQSTRDFEGETETEKQHRELLNDMETLRFKFNLHRDKKARAEFHRKINEIKEKINLLIN